MIDAIRVVVLQADGESRCLILPHADALLIARILATVCIALDGKPCDRDALTAVATFARALGDNALTPKEQST